MILFKKIMDRTLETGAVVSTAGMIVAVTVQIIGRFLLTQAPSWTEEASRLFFVLAVGFAAGLGVRDQSYVRLDFPSNLLPARPQCALRAMIHLVVASFMGLAAFYAIRFVQLGNRQVSPTLQIPMSYAFVSVFIMSFFVSVYALIEASAEVRRWPSGAEK